MYIVCIYIYYSINFNFWSLSPSWIYMSCCLDVLSLRVHLEHTNYKAYNLISFKSFTLKWIWTCLTSIYVVLKCFNQYLCGKFYKIGQFRFFVFTFSLLSLLPSLLMSFFHLGNHRAHPQQLSPSLTPSSLYFQKLKMVNIKQMNGGSNDHTIPS